MQHLLRFLNSHWLLISIVVLAVALRGYQLGQTPHGITWDEAAIGYNGYAVILTRRDEWLHRLPISFQSFGDYKAPLAIYVSGVFTTLLMLGLTPMGIRLPFFLSGVLAVVGVYFLVEVLLEKLGQKNSHERRTVALFSAFWLAISPWHIHFTRTAFESGLALTLIIWGVFGWLKALVNKDSRWWWLSCVSLVLSFYAYHSAKLVVPLLIISLILMSWQALWQQRKQLLGPIIVGALLLLPLVADALWGPGLTRAGALLFSQHLPASEFWRILLENLRLQFGFDFWFRGATNTLRHGDGYTGVLYWSDLALLLLAVGWLIKHWSQLSQMAPESKLLGWGVLWSLMGLAPAFLASEVPHPNRALLTLLGLSLVFASLFNFAVKWFAEKQLVLVTGIIVLGYLSCLANYQWYYYTVFAKTSSEAFFDGYFQAATRTVQLEKQPPNTTKIDKILFTSHYGQPYIFILLARRTNPIWYQGGALSQYEFSNHITMGDLERSQTLVIASATDELPNAVPDEVITDTAGVVKFKIFYPHESRN